MAGVHSPAFFSSTPPISPTSRLTNRLLIAYSVSNSKIKRRKNHLRPKILKTLTKPNPFLTPLLPPREQTSHILSISSPSPNDVEGEVSVSPTENLNKPGVSTDGEDDGVVDLQVSETTGPVGNYKTFVGEVAQSRKLWELRRQNPHGFMGKNHKTSRTLGKGAVLNLNGNSKHGQLENMSGTNDTRVKQSNIETGFWWLKLPYVLVIFMRGGSGQEKQRGLYTAKFTSCEQDQHDSSYTVAFEDHADANNFSFLLESFFEEMGNFTVDVVPLSIQELHEAVKSNTMKVIVVKKRQLQLYAGQPLADVEEALHSLIEQNEVSSQTNFG